MLDINLLEFQKINFPFQKSLFPRLGLLVIIFTIALLAVVYYQYEYSYTTQDSILDAHENYYYSKMISSWGSPPDTTKMQEEIENLQMWCGAFNRVENDSGVFAGELYWSNLPEELLLDEFYHWLVSSDYEENYNIEIPNKVYFGEINTLPTTVVDNGKYLFYIIIDYIPPSEWNNFIVASILTTLFMLVLFLFLRRYLRPVHLMKKRIHALEEGDLESRVEIIGKDELAELSKSMNQLIGEIKSLLDKKHQLLLDVSHELRSPLARMQLLIELMPEHKNREKLKGEVIFLEGMISNLLLSDKLSEPYSKLELKSITSTAILEKVLQMFPGSGDVIKINNNIPGEMILVDETKFCLALRNLLDNALKYSQKKPRIELSITKNTNLEISVKDNGSGISKENIKKITEPFFQANTKVSTKGFGLGLTICRKIIEAHKGSLIIQSELGKGSIFTLLLPA